MYLRAKDISEFPEWRDPPTREAVTKEGVSRVSMDWSLFFWTTALLLPGLAWWLLDFNSGWWPSLLRLAIVLCLLALFEYLLINWQKRIFMRSIRNVLREKGVQICAHCAYPLEGLATVPRCPECGASSAEMSPVGNPEYSFVRANGLVICARCRYNLSGLQSPTSCPECGNALAGL